MGTSRGAVGKIFAYKTFPCGSAWEFLSYRIPPLTVSHQKLLSLETNSQEKTNFIVIFFNMERGGWILWFKSDFSYFTGILTFTRQTGNYRSNRQCYNHRMTFTKSVKRTSLERWVGCLLRFRIHNYSPRNMGYCLGWMNVFHYCSWTQCTLLHFTKATLYFTAAYPIINQKIFGKTGALHQLDTLARGISVLSSGEEYGT